MKQRPQRLYVMGSDIGLVKLGISDDPEARRRNIQGTSGIRLRLAHSSDARPDARAVEAAAHKLLHEKRRTGEWFDVTEAEAIAAIAEAEAIIEQRRLEARRKQGRPTIYPEPLERIQMLVTAEQRREAKREAAERGVSESKVYRDWIDAGRKRK